VFAYLQTHARSEDAIIFTFPDPAPEYYAQGRWPVFLVPPQAPPDPNAVIQIATGISVAHPRIWLIPQWSRSWDEHRLTEQTLDTLAERAAEPAVGGFHLVLYHTPLLYEAERTPLSSTLGDNIRLIGFTLRQPDGAATHRLMVHPGDTIRLALYWRADQKPETDYSVFVHLLDEAGQVQSQQDNWPRAGAYPTSWWSPGEIVVDTYVLPIRPDTLPGSYTLVTGMYDSTGARLKTTGDQADAGNSRISLPVEVDIQSP
jgi:hypothetical protein